MADEIKYQINVQIADNTVTKDDPDDKIFNVVSQGTADKERVIAEMMAVNPGLERETLRHVLDLENRVVMKLLLNGMRVNNGLFEAAPQCKGVVRGTAWDPAVNSIYVNFKQGKEMREAMPQKARLHLPGTLSLAEYRNLLRAASLLVCVPGSAVPASTLLEAMSAGAAPVLVPEEGPAFLRHEKNAFFFRGEDTAAFLASLLEARAALAFVRSGARAAVLARFEQKKATQKHVRLLLEAFEAWKKDSR